MPADGVFGLFDNIKFVLNGHLQILKMLGIPRADFSEQLSL